MIIIPLSYNLLFRDDSFYESLKNVEVPSSLAIAILSGINHRLYLGKNPDDIFADILEGWDEEFQTAFKTSIEQVRHKNSAPIPIFSEWAITEYLKVELLNHNNLELDTTSSTGIFEVTTLIRYFKYVDDLIKSVEQENVITDELGAINFLKTSYTSFIKQFQFTGKNHPIFEMLCCYSFLTEMKQRFPQQVRDYLKSYEVENEWQFATAMMPVISESIPSKNNIYFPFLKPGESGNFQKFFMHRIIDIENYKKNEKLQLRYIGLQSKPLYQIDPTNLCVMSWRFLYNNIGTGVLFDFYDRTNLKNIYDSLPKFKSEIVSLQVYERIIFQSMIKAIYEQKHTKIEFDQGKGTPDCYIRKGNKLFLIEFKDMLFSDQVVDKGSYEDIINLCKRNLVENSKGKAKGISQIIKQIQYLDSEHYDFDNFTEEGVKRSSINVYPIIVYSHKQFAFSGINKLIIEEFQNRLTPNTFKTVHKPILISLDYLFSRKILEYV